MTGMISAELLRLRTVTAHHWGLLGVIALIAANAAPFGGGSTSPDAVTAQVRGLVQVGVVLIAACAAYLVAEEFRRGSAALTYLRHPVRAPVSPRREASRTRPSAGSSPPSSRPWPWGSC